MLLDVRRMQLTGPAELYINVQPGEGDVDRQGEEVFAAVAEVLGDQGGKILEERIFCTDSAMPALTAARARACGELDDGVRPTRLVVPPCALGDFSGVLVHAAVGTPAPQVVRVGDLACGRALDLDAGRYVTLCGITAPEAGGPEQQARAMLEKCEAALKTVGGDMHSVVRTWMWLGDILDWYDGFNGVRNRFFHERGLLNDAVGKRELPASTGIGVGPAGPAVCAMDLIAVTSEGCEPQYILAGGDQNPAYDYGSAFSRASRNRTPGGETVFVSGTAAIDADGNTEHVDDIDRQIADTIAHVRAVLRDTHVTDRDVVNSLIYCKTPAVEAAFREKFSRDLPWPQVTMISDVCRDDLLFEIEATAAPGAVKI